MEPAEPPKADKLTPGLRFQKLVWCYSQRRSNLAQYTYSRVPDAALYAANVRAVKVGLKS